MTHLVFVLALLDVACGKSAENSKPADKAAGPPRAPQSELVTVGEGFLAHAVDDDHGGMWLLIKGGTTSLTHVCRLANSTVKCGDLPDSIDATNKGRFVNLFAPAPGAEPLVVQDRGERVTPRYRLVTPFTWTEVAPVTNNNDGIVWSDGAVMQRLDDKVISVRAGTAGPHVLDRPIAWMNASPTTLTWRERSAGATQVFQAPITATGFGPIHAAGTVPGDSLKFAASGDRICAYEMFGHAFSLLDANTGREISKADAAFLSEHVWCGRGYSGVVDMASGSMIQATLCKGDTCSAVTTPPPFSVPVLATAILDGGLVAMTADAGHILIATNTGAKWQNQPPIAITAPVTSLTVLPFSGGLVVHTSTGQLLVLDSQARPVGLALAN